METGCHLLRGIVVFLLAITCRVDAQRMIVRETQTILEIDQAEVSVEVVGGVAETIYDLRFRNDSDRAVEGEFSIPLPEGATVSKYALEVNGALREAVAVEKERARIAYETIKRQMIDPGIVEREAGNIYRTRVYPVPAKGTKQLRIGYVETLRSFPGGIGYTVPLSFHGKLSSFKLRTRHDGNLRFSGDLPASLAEGATKGERNYSLSDVKVEGRMEVILPDPKAPLMMMDGASEPAFVLTDRFPDLPVVQRPTPKRIQLLWDASESAASVDRKRLFALLDAWFAKLGNVEIDLRLVRDAVSDGGVYRIKKGDWKSLRKRLDEVVYDGATSLGGIGAGSEDSDLVVYCGDGVVTLPQAIGKLSKPLIFLRTGSGEATAALRAMARSTGGTEVLVDASEVATALESMSREPYRVKVSGSTIAEDLEIGETARPGGLVHITGRMHSPALLGIEITYGVGNEVHVRRGVRPQPVSNEGMVRRVRAQAKLSQLEKAVVRDRDAILHLCKGYGLVSDETSLIVLERFEDHLTYKIPPPERDLLVKYNKELEAQQGKADQRREKYFLSTWQSRLKWYDTPFPGAEHELLPPLRQISIWKRAMETVFDRSEIDAASFDAVVGWQDRVLAMIERRKQLATVAEYEAWKGEIDPLKDEFIKVTSIVPKGPPPGKPLAVSVRGQVRNPRKLNGVAGMTLVTGLKEAGDLMGRGNLESVALYRSGGKTLYNTLSKDFTDFPLAPGDMLVVESGWSSFPDAADPFSSEGTARSGPPAAERMDVWVPQGGGSDSVGYGSSGSGDPFAGGGGTGAELKKVRLMEAGDGVSPDLAEFQKRIERGDDPEAAYRKLRDGKFLSNRSCIQIARILCSRGHGSLAQRILSTLVERGNGSVPSLMAHALWLMEFRQADAAKSVLELIGPGHDELALDLIRRELETDPAAAAELLAESLEDLKEGSDAMGASMVLTELNAIRPDSSDPRFSRNLEMDLRITLVGTLGQSAPAFTVIEPEGSASAGWSFISPCGGIRSRSEGVTEYMIKRAVPGKYVIQIQSEPADTVRLSIYTGWGRADQKVQRSTFFIEEGDKRDVAETEFQFSPAK